MNRPLRPPPAPVAVDARRVVLVGTALWALALVVLVAFWGVLADAGHLHWIGTCGAGVVLGVIGLVVTRRHRDADRPE